MRKTALGFLVLLAAGCGSPLPTNATGDSENSPGSAAVVPMELPVGWDTVTGVYNGAEITVYDNGHYHTTRNACTYNDENGAATLEDWNELARGLNLAMAMPPLTDAKCFARPDQPHLLDGFADVKTPSGKRPIFEARGGEICSLIPDTDLARKILMPLSRIFHAAQYEGCP